MINNRIPAIQFIFGINENVVPEIFLTRSLNGTTGTATFRFKNPNILDKSTAKEGEITGMYLVDEEGIKLERINDLEIVKQEQEPVLIDRHDSHLKPVEPKKW